jgi:streptogramin lyase
VDEEDTAVRSIALGPDNAFWMTLSAEGVSGDRDAIGRMTVDGSFESWQLPRPQSEPVQIVAGTEGDLWFATDRRAGRITTEGEIDTWPVPGADNLYNIAVGEDGDVWITDGEAGVVHHLDPPL